MASVRFFAAAAEAAGDEERATTAPDVGALRAELGAEPALGRVLPRCSILVDGRRADDTASIAGDATVDVLPPFAGG